MKLRYLPSTVLQALPSHKPSCERMCRTKPILVVEGHMRLRPGRHVAFPMAHGPTISVKRFSGAQATFSTNPRHASPTTNSSIVFSAGQPEDLPDRASKLLSSWSLSASKKGITRQYTFSSFSKAWTFMTKVAEECKTKRHHPSWSNLYNVVNIEWTTHKPEGLSIKDIEMAEYCDQTAEEIGLKP
ncbi:pterin 4 alpha carbinolamine dehydratase-domain-containing protein [Paraphoma chrysanthemicola]|nr:pterin 4 alpha carbinolamine dehydratase-domain-containing protein [Paraphoma chrysanthemicola]